MTAKTQAEQQLEFLKKLKEQQKAAAARPQRARSPIAAVGEAQGSSVPKPQRRGRKHPARRLPLSEEAWQTLRREVFEPGKFKLNLSLGELIAELLVFLPNEIQSLSAEKRRELFSRWARDLSSKPPQ